MCQSIVTVRSLVLGDGIPKLCIPITAKNRTELEAQARHLLTVPCDLAEWRADFFEETQQDGWLLESLHLLRTILGDKPILFTFRTAQEGGARAISMEQYQKWTVAAAASGFADLVDVELNRGESCFTTITEQVHRCRKMVLASFHDFEQTPDQERLLQILCRMQELNADLCKAAVMPANAQDVLTLLQTSLAMKEQYADRPYITMSMSTLGGISRLCGALTGSALTFASAGNVSAPGQMDAALVKQVLQVLQTH